MNTSYPNMITSGTYASVRTLGEDSTGMFTYIQKGDYVTSYTYGDITGITLSQANPGEPIAGNNENFSIVINRSGTPKQNRTPV